MAKPELYREKKLYIFYIYMITNYEMAALEYVMGSDREIYGRAVSGNQKYLISMKQTPTKQDQLCLYKRESTRLTSYHRQNAAPKEPMQEECTSTDGTDTTTNYPLAPPLSQVPKMIDFRKEV